MNTNGIQPGDVHRARAADHAEWALDREQRALRERIPTVFYNTHDGPWRQTGQLRAWGHTRVGANDVWVWRLEHHVRGQPARVLARSDVRMASSQSYDDRNTACAAALRDLYERVWWSRSASDPSLISRAVWLCALLALADTEDGSVLVRFLFLRGNNNSGSSNRCRVGGL
ncbi:hypothetical protein UCRNP2_8594 [Neofusicoccum parvum UCRNP2]|uniref:Uncharacterized protein n=1 Tax=Botryosphaeria parva (strain UCR-NP2) TaxID=1287680 RepID=R1G948_BOTPV|nr:hypothetical protein UCRNP2_8594 [Neofusicoccum parvum UCRNP2]